MRLLQWLLRWRWRRSSDAVAVAAAWRAADSRRDLCCDWLCDWRCDCCFAGALCLRLQLLCRCCYCCPYNYCCCCCCSGRASCSPLLLLLLLLSILPVVVAPVPLWPTVRQFAQAIQCHARTRTRTLWQTRSKCTRTHTRFVYRFNLQFDVHWKKKMFTKFALPSAGAPCKVPRMREMQKQNAHTRTNRHTRLAG